MRIFSARQAHRCLRPDRPGRPARPRGRRHRNDRSPRVRLRFFEILRRFIPESGQRLGTSFPPNCKVCVNEIWKTHHCNSRGWAIARGRVALGVCLCVSRVPPAWRCDDQRTTPRPAMAESPRRCQGHRGDPKPSVPGQAFAGDRRNRPTQSFTHETFTLWLPQLRPSPRSLVPDRLPAEGDGTKDLPKSCHGVPFCAILMPFVRDVLFRLVVLTITRTTPVSNQAGRLASDVCENCSARAEIQ